MPYKILDEHYSVQLCVEQDSMLVSKLFYKGQLYDIMYLTTLTKNETSLNDGAFKHYDKDQQQHKVQFVYDSNQQRCEVHVNTILKWIEENIKNKWNMNVWIIQTNKGRKVLFDLSFADANEAILIKLTGFN